MGFTIEKAKRNCGCYLCKKTIEQGDERVALNEVYINYFAHPICALKVVDKKSKKLTRKQVSKMTAEAL